MAKDKSKKTESKSSRFAKPSEAKAGDSWSLVDGDKPESEQNVGELFLMTPLREEEVETQAYGTKKVIVADVVHLNAKKPEKSELHEEVFIFQGWLRGALRGSIGGDMVLGRLTKVKDKSAGKGYVWKFEDASEKDVEVAEAYLDATNPFGKKKKAAADDDEPKKKSKKKK